MKTVNAAVSVCSIIPLNSVGEILGKFAAHCFRRGGSKHLFVTGESIWPLYMVKCWVGWGASEYMNTIIRYLLEEISKYEHFYTHYLYSRGSDSCMFNTKITSFEYTGREITWLQSTFVQRLSRFEQSYSATNCLIDLQDLSSTYQKIHDSLNVILQTFRENILSDIQASLSGYFNTGNISS